jgi:hypothetical protein
MHQVQRVHQLLTEPSMIETSSAYVHSLDSRGAFIVGVRGRGWVEPGPLRKALAAVNLEGVCPTIATPHEALHQAMSDSFPGPHTVVSLPKNKGLCVLRFVSSDGGRLKEGMPVYAASVDKAGLVVELVFDPEDNHAKVLALYEGFKTKVSPGRLVIAVRDYALRALGGAKVDSLIWLPPRVLPTWNLLVGAFAGTVRVSSVRPSVDEETAKGIIDHVTEARMKEATTIGEKLLALDPVKLAAGNEIRYLAKRARELELQLAKDEADLGVSLESVRLTLKRAQATNTVGLVQEAIAGSNPTE